MGSVCVLLATTACGPTTDERRTSIYELKSQPTADNIERIRGWLEDPDRDVRATALNALIGLAVPDSADLATGALDDPDGFVRATAAKLLGDLGDARHVDAIGRLLDADPDPVVRQRAAESLMRLGGDAVLPYLTRGLADPMERVRRAAVQGVSKLDPLAAKEALVRLLHEDAVWEIRAEAAHALGLTGDPGIMPELERALEDANEYVRTAATNALRLHGEARGRMADAD
jgi:HEAT repeat protein